MSVASLMTSYVQPRVSVDQQDRVTCVKTKECRGYTLIAVCNGKERVCPCYPCTAFEHRKSQRHSLQSSTLVKCICSAVASSRAERTSRGLLPHMSWVTCMRTLDQSLAQQIASLYCQWIRPKQLNSAAIVTSLKHRQ